MSNSRASDSAAAVMAENPKEGLACQCCGAIHGQPHHDEDAGGVLADVRLIARSECQLCREGNEEMPGQVFVVAITRDRQPRSFRFQLRPGYSQPAASISRAVASAAAARREAERVFGKLQWDSPADHQVTEAYVVWVAKAWGVGL